MVFTGLSCQVPWAHSKEDSFTISALGRFILYIYITLVRPAVWVRRDASSIVKVIHVSSGSVPGHRLQAAFLRGHHEKVEQSNHLTPHSVSVQ